MIPHDSQKGLLQRMHVSHPGLERFVSDASRLWIWPGMKNQITQLWSGCDVCQRERRMKEEPEPMTTLMTDCLAPMEVLSLDFGSYGGRNYLVGVCRGTGYILAEVTKHQSTDEVIETLEKWFTNHGFSKLLLSDNGPSFRDRFRLRMKELGVDTSTSSPLHSSGNGLAEAGVKEVKDVLKKNGPLTGQELQKFLFERNTRQSSTPGAGSPWTRFHRREPRKSGVPSLMRDVNQLQIQEMITKRREAQEKTARERGRSSREEFQAGDKVRMWNPSLRNWSYKGTVVEGHASDDGVDRSFSVELDDGRILRRNSTFLHHRAMATGSGGETVDESGNAQDGREFLSPICCISMQSCPAFTVSCLYSSSRLSALRYQCSARVYQ